MLVSELQPEVVPVTVYVVVSVGVAVFTGPYPLLRDSIGDHENWSAPDTFKLTGSSLQEIESEAVSVMMG